MNGSRYKLHPYIHCNIALESIVLLLSCLTGKCLLGHVTSDMSDSHRICVCGRERGKEPIIITITTCKKHHSVKTEGGSVCVSPPTNEPLSELSKNTKQLTGHSSKDVENQPVTESPQPFEGKAINQQRHEGVNNEKKPSSDPTEEIEQKTGDQLPVSDKNDISTELVDSKLTPRQMSIDEIKSEDTAKESAIESDLQSVRAESETQATETAEVIEDHASIHQTVEEKELTESEEMSTDGTNELTTSSHTVEDTDDKRDDQPVSNESETQTTETAQLIIQSTDEQIGNKPAQEPPITDIESNVHVEEINGSEETGNDEGTEKEQPETENAAKPHNVENDQLEEDENQEIHEESELSATKDEKPHSETLDSIEEEKYNEIAEDDDIKKSGDILQQSLIQIEGSQTGTEEQPGIGGVELTGIEPDAQPTEEIALQEENEDEQQSADTSSPSENADPAKEQNNEIDSKTEVKSLNNEEIIENIKLNDNQSQNSEILDQSSTESGDPQQDSESARTETENSNKQTGIESSANELPTSAQAVAINTSRTAETVTQDVGSSPETEIFENEEFPNETENIEPVLVESMLPAESSSIKILKNESARYLDEENDSVKQEADYQSDGPLDVESPEEKSAKLSNELMKQSDTNTSGGIEENKSKQAANGQPPEVDAEMNEIYEYSQNASVEQAITDQESSVIEVQSLEAIEDFKKKDPVENGQQAEPSNIEELETNILEPNNELGSDLVAPLESGFHDGSKVRQSGSLDVEDKSAENLKQVSTTVASSVDDALEDTANIIAVEDSSVDRQQESETLQNDVNGENDPKIMTENGSSTSEHASYDAINKNNPTIIMRTETAMNTVMPNFDRLFWNIILPIFKSRRLVEKAKGEIADTKMLLASRQTNNQGTATISADENVKNLADLLRSIEFYTENQQVGQYLNEQDILNLGKYTSMANYKDTCEQTSSSHMGEMYSQIITSDQGLQVGTSYIFNRKNTKWYEGLLICFGVRASDSLYDIGNLNDDLLVDTKSSYIVTKYLRI